MKKGYPEKLYPLLRQGDWCYWIEANGYISSGCYHTTDDFSAPNAQFQTLIDMGNLFATKQEAQAEKERRMAEAHQAPKEIYKDLCLNPHIFGNKPEDKSGAAGLGRMGDRSWPKLDPDFETLNSYVREIEFKNEKLRAQNQVDIETIKGLQDKNRQHSNTIKVLFNTLTANQRDELAKKYLEL